MIRNQKLDLNCDLGEGEPIARTRALMRWITSANVACGGHAGDLASMQCCVRLARQFRVRLGAHPGPWSRGDFGRTAVQLTPDELELLLLQQVGALEQIANQGGARLHHIKLHGALYHASEAKEAIGRRYVQSVARWWPRAVIYAQAAGNVARLAKSNGVEVWEEAFADRGYEDRGELVPRTKPGALLRDVSAVGRRVQMIVNDGQVETISGARIPLRPQTLCVHSDTPGSPAIARVVWNVLRRASAE
ncbi:MAG: LamB/YcsF family protein [Verrucomicrobia bacterium]|nr:LamB/YcsF family protein [Verrucomicrobiota bacterium]